MAPPAACEPRASRTYCLALQISVVGNISLSSWRVMWPTIQRCGSLARIRLFLVSGSTVEVPHGAQDHAEIVALALKGTQGGTQLLLDYKDPLIFNT